MIWNAAGGECADDIAHLRKDAAGELLGHELPRPGAARKFLCQFHAEEKVEQAQPHLPTGKTRSIVEESDPLARTGRGNTDVVQALAAGCAEF